MRGTVPLESWNMVGIRILPKLRSADSLNLAVDLSVQVDLDMLQTLESDVRQALTDLKLDELVRIEHQRGNGAD